MRNPDTIPDAERIQMASRLPIKNIIDEGLINKGMWVKYLGARYTRSNYRLINRSR